MDDSIPTNNDNNIIPEVKLTSPASLNDENVTDDRESPIEPSANLPNPTENELINVDEIELSDEDTWLYSSPNNKKDEKDISAYKWLRKDVEDLNNRELQLAKTALVSKLDELEILRALPREKKPNEQKLDDSVNCDILEEQPKTIETRSDLSIESPSSHLNGKHSEIEASHATVLEAKSQASADLSDIFERARQQEESLKVSAARFLSNQAVNNCLESKYPTRVLPRGTHLISPTVFPGCKLQKPASIEALHAYNGRQSTSVTSPVIAAPHTNNSSPSRSPYGSSVSLNYSQDIHRSSLPNLNKGYYSLKKVKRPSESRIQCPLPIYPKHDTNAASRESASLSKAAMLSPTRTQTLPSSYRAKSKSIATPNRDLIPVARRDSAPSPKCQRSLPLGQISRRESNPNFSPQRDVLNGRHNMMSSPRKSSFSQHYAPLSPSFQKSRTVSLNYLSQDSGVSPIKEYPRNASQSPVRRYPLTSVHNCSLDEDDTDMVHNNGELRKLSLPSKIPNPASRSGIPVPSSNTRSNHTNGSWEKNC